MYQRGRETSTDELGDRGVSPQVGFILLFGMVIVGAVLIFLVGTTALDAFQTQASAERGEQMMLEFDNDLQTALIDDGTSGSVYLEENGNYDISTDGQIKITAENEYANKSTTIDLGTLRYEDSAGNVFAHQAGGVWRGEGDDSSVVTRPNIRYSEQGDRGRVDFTVTDLEGDITPGENKVVKRPESTVEDDFSEDIGFVNYVEIEVTGTSYHNAWADFLQDEFNASSRDDCDVDNPDETIICHDEPAESVTVIAPIEGENPFASHVGIDPTIYGGLYVEDSSLSINESVTVDRYNSSAGYDPDNVTEDLLVANGGLELGSNANVTGVPVVNGDLSGEEGANTSSIAFATRPDGDRIDVINGTEVYNVTGADPPGVFGAKLSRSFIDIDDIDQQTDRALYLIEDYEDTVTGATGTLESKPDESEDGFYYFDRSVDESDISDIDTSDGDVHVAVDGNLDLEGNEYTDFVTGGGQAYFYVAGDISIDEISIEDARSKNLWIYGTSDAAITVNDEFQGVIYAPNSDSLTLTTGTEVFGTIVGGDGVDIREGVAIHYDKNLRTDIPIPEENRDVTIEIANRRPPLDVTFVLDRSGSMEDNDEERKRVDATRKFLGLMKEGDSDVLEGNQGDQAGVYEFDQNGYEIHHLSDDLEAVNDSIRTAEQGSTDMSVGMEPALDEYPVNGSDSAERHMILLSDGENTVTERECTNRNFWGWCTNWEYVYDSDEETMNQAERAADMNVTIHTIGLGDGIDEEMLKDIANKTGGDYYPVDDNDELEEIFEGIADDVTASAATTFEVAALDEPMRSPNDYAVNVREQAVRIGE